MEEEKVMVHDDEEDLEYIGPSKRNPMENWTVKFHQDIPSDLFDQYFYNVRFSVLEGESTFTFETKQQWSETDMDAFIEEITDVDIHYSIKKN